LFKGEEISVKLEQLTQLSRKADSSKEFPWPQIRNLNSAIYRFWQRHKQVLKGKATVNTF
jgi:hypothetical protein